MKGNRDELDYDDGLEEPRFGHLDGPAAEGHEGECVVCGSLLFVFGDSDGYCAKCKDDFDF